LATAAWSPASFVFARASLRQPLELLGEVQQAAVAVLQDQKVADGIEHAPA